MRDLPEIETHDATDRASWLAMRRRDLTASDLGAVLGMDPHSSALVVWSEKRGLTAPQADNDAMKRGRVFEAAALEYLAMERPDLRSIRRPGVYLRAPSWRLGATPDAYAEDAEGRLGVIQIKVLSPEAALEWADGGAPDRYQIQTLCESMLADAKWGLLVGMEVDFMRIDLIQREIPRHAAMEAVIREAAADFARCLDDGIQPAVRCAADSRTLDRLSKGDAPPLDWSGDAEAAAMIRRRLRLKAEAKAATAEADLIDAALKERMGNASRAKCGAYSISWPVVSRKEVVIPAGESRMFTVSERRAAHGEPRI